jgi:hypothetical protein
MPLTEKGREIKANMTKEYGKEKGNEVFYASANKGTITGVHNDRSDKMSDSPSDPYESMKRIRAANERKNIEEAATRREAPPKEASKDVIAPKPASGPMSTKGPNDGTSEGLPKTVEPFSKVTDSCPGMSLDAIKAMGKRVGRY